MLQLLTKDVLFLSDMVNMRGRLLSHNLHDNATAVKQIPQNVMRTIQKVVIAS